MEGGRQGWLGWRRMVRGNMETTVLEQQLKKERDLYYTFGGTVFVVSALPAQPFMF